MANETPVDHIGEHEVLYALGVSLDGSAVLTWRSNDGVEHAELDPQSADVKEAIALLRKIIWGG